MKIAVIGSGAMGSVFAGLFAESGHEVWVLDRWRDHIEHIKNNGLHLDGISGSRFIQLNATHDITNIGICDLVIIATKAMDVEEAATGLEEIMSSKTDVISIQNGMGGPQIAERLIGFNRVVVGVAGGFGASIISPGHVHHNGWDFVRLGELNGLRSDRLARLHSLWSGVGFRVECFDDIHQLIWEKLICNTCFSAICAITESTIGEVMKNDHSWVCALNCAVETYNVAIAKGINVRVGNVASYVKEFGSKIPNARPSMLLDYSANRLSEIDFINGSVEREGLRLGEPTPFNKALGSIIRSKEHQRGLRKGTE